MTFPNWSMLYWADLASLRFYNANNGHLSYYLFHHCCPLHILFDTYNFRKRGNPCRQTKCTCSQLAVRFRSSQICERQRLRLRLLILICRLLAFAMHRIASKHWLEGNALKVHHAEESVFQAFEVWSGYVERCSNYRWCSWSRTVPSVTPRESDSSSVRFKKINLPIIHCRSNITNT